MAANTADNWLQPVHNGAYGNASVICGTYANLLTSSAVAADTFDLAKIPAGAELISGFIYSTQMTGTSTLAIGVRYADGTSTGGTTGTAVLVAGTASAVSGYSQTNLRFLPFTNDADTIVYATFASGPAPVANDNMELVLYYNARGSK